MGAFSLLLILRTIPNHPFGRCEVEAEVIYWRQEDKMGKRQTGQEEDRPVLEWRESRKIKRQDELRLGDQTVATLRWGGWGSTFAEGRARARSWTFERPCLLSREVHVHVAGVKSSPIAVFVPGWTEEGTLSCADGRTMRWQSRDFWRTEWAFVDAEGRTAVRFEDTSGFLEQRTIAHTYKTGLSEADRAMLLILGRYLMVLQAQDQAAVTAAVVAAIG
jgi:hypothetical protein